MKNVFELSPINGRKSFYGKAKVIVDNGIAELLSYDTIVATYDLDLKLYVQDRNDWSNTTSSHIRAFKEFYKISV